MRKISPWDWCKVGKWEKSHHEVGAKLENAKMRKISPWDWCKVGRRRRSTPKQRQVNKRSDGGKLLRKTTSLTLSSFQAFSVILFSILECREKTFEKNNLFDFVIFWGTFCDFLLYFVMQRKKQPLWLSHLLQLFTCLLCNSIHICRFFIIHIFLGVFQKRA